MPKAIPDGYNTVSPYLAVDGAEQAIAFYEKAFGAKERGRMPPKELGGTSASLMVYVEDVDAVVEQAIGAGATLEREVEDQFWGDRFGAVTDPFGHVWTIATHVEDVAPEEMEKRAQAAMAAMST